MSDVVLDRPSRDRRRAVVSIAAATVVHAAVIGALALVLAASPAAAPAPEFLVDLQLASTPLESPTIVESPAAAGATRVSDSSAGNLGRQASPGGDSSFVIPTPRGQSPDAPLSATGGSGFRQAGGTTGGAASLPAVQSTLPGPTLPASQSGTAAGTGTGSAQRGGQGVAVNDSAAGGTGNSLDLGGLDKALPGLTAGGGRGTGTTGGTGSGSGGTGASGGGSTAGPGYQVVWDQPDKSKGREVVSAVTPNIPAWVSKQGLTLSVTVSFTLGPDGLVSEVKVDQSSGYADVDSSVLAAIRRWRFTSARGAAAIKGIIPYKITSH